MIHQRARTLTLMAFRHDAAARLVIGNRGRAYHLSVKFHRRAPDTGIAYPEKWRVGVGTAREMEARRDELLEWVREQELK